MDCESGFPCAYSVIAWDPVGEILTIRIPWGHGERNDDTDATEDGVFEYTLAEFMTTFTLIAYKYTAGRANRLTGTPKGASSPRQRTSLTASQCSLAPKRLGGTTAFSRFGVVMARWFATNSRVDRPPLWW